MGGGRQYWSWIAIDDAVGAIHHALITDALRGPSNAVAPPRGRGQCGFTSTLSGFLSQRRADDLNRTWRVQGDCL
jgi:NAD dependent epimerase/dehydratase family enzyme